MLLAVMLAGHPFPSLLFDSLNSTRRIEYRKIGARLGLEAGLGRRPLGAEVRSDARLILIKCDDDLFAGSAHDAG
jgi:hypothetical protein